MIYFRLPPLKARQKIPAVNAGVKRGIVSYIIAENISHAFGAQGVLKEISFQIGESDRIGLVGPNGGGKTTLMRILAGLLEPSVGRAVQRKGLRIGYLPQVPPDMGESTVHDAMLEVFAQLRSMEGELHELAADLAGKDLKRYGALLARFEALGGYGYHTRIEQVLTALGLGQELWSHPLSKLSGGQRTRAYLASLLLQEPDLLMLDEPTNHLDLEAVEWLEYWLNSFKGSLVVVSHDRYLLDHATEYTWELAFGRMETFRGAYSRYVTQKEERQAERLRQWEADQEHIGKTREFIARHMAGQRSKEAKGRLKRLERFLRDEAVDRPRELRTIKVELSTDRRSGDIVARAEGLGVGFNPERPLLKVDELVAERGDRVAIVGANGVGKTTLLRTLLGQVEPLEGIFRLGSQVRVGYLSQAQDDLDPAATVLDALLEADPKCKVERARSLLGSLLLAGDDVFKRIGNLSGGERSRVVLARLMLKKANLLALDEPTNHLDIPSTEIIQDVLSRFEGTILLVSHDRFLIEAVATHIWALEDGTVHCILGGWEEYLRWREERRGARGGGDGVLQERQERKAQYRETRRRSNLIQRFRRRHEELEAEIEKVEGELADIGQKISRAGLVGDLDSIERLGVQYQQREALLKDLWDEWERVSEDLERESRT